MIKEYLFNHSSNPPLELGDNFDSSPGTADTQYLIANIKVDNAEVYAPEINFYLNNTSDCHKEKTENVRRLYAVRNIAFASSSSFEQSFTVGENVLVISEKTHPDLEIRLEERGFVPFAISPSEVITVRGCIGNLQVSTTHGGVPHIINTDQIVWFDAPQHLLVIKGIFDPLVTDHSQILEQITNEAGRQTYFLALKYANFACLHHLKKHDVCGVCVDLCPSKAITKGQDKSLEINHIQCIACGQCMAACPSGALDSAAFPRSSFSSLCAQFTGKSVLILPNQDDIWKIELTLPPRLLPFVVDAPSFLDESHLLTLLQTSGRPIIFYNPAFSEVSQQIISFINAIFSQIYHCQAIFPCSTEQELMEAFASLESFDKDWRYTLPQSNLGKREIFARRLAHICQDEDSRVIPVGKHLQYGQVTVNQDACTLCLCCVEACGMNALTASSKDNSLRFNPSLCSGCGYCVEICPEHHCLQLVTKQFSLHPQDFMGKIVAQDELFACVECGKKFAPAKSISKITSLMKSVFSNNPAKLKSLSCCPDCKAKIMLQSLTIDNLND